MKCEKLIEEAGDFNSGVKGPCICRACTRKLILDLDFTGLLDLAARTVMPTYCVDCHVSGKKETPATFFIKGVPRCGPCQEKSDDGVGEGQKIKEQLAVPRKKDWAAMQDARNRKMSIREVASEFGVSAQTVMNHTKPPGGPAPFQPKTYPQGARIALPGKLGAIVEELRSTSDGSLEDDLDSLTQRLGKEKARLEKRLEGVIAAMDSVKQVRRLIA